MQDSLKIIEGQIALLGKEVDHAYTVINNADLFISLAALLFGVVTIFGIGFQIYRTRQLKNVWNEELAEKNKLKESLAKLSLKEKQLEEALDQLDVRIERSNEFYRNMLNAITIDIVKEIIFTLHSSGNYEDAVVELLLNRTYFRELLVRLHTKHSDVIQTCNELHFFTNKDIEYLPEMEDCVSTITYLVCNVKYESFVASRLIHLKVEMEKRIEKLKATSNIV